MVSQDELKQKAAFRAVEFVDSDMVIGLGTGSTTRFAVERIAACIKAGELKNIVGIPSSVQTEELAQKLGIPLAGFEEHAQIDVTIDGADEVDPDLDLIKGGGGALLREKVLAQASRKNIIIVDDSKLTPKLGSNWALPVEVVPFAWKAEELFLNALGASVSVRTLNDGRSFRTDQGNLILDAFFGPMADPKKMALILNERAGIVEHGLFLGLASDVIVAGKEGIRQGRDSAARHGMLECPDGATPHE